MAFPITVSADLITVSQNNFGGYGPFEDGNNRYVAGINNAGITNKAAIYKSTDFGATWNEMDASNEQGILTAFGNSLSICRDSNLAVRKLYAVFVSSVDSKLRLATFSMVTDTWTTIVASILANNGVESKALMESVCAHRNSDNKVVVVNVSADSGAIFFQSRTNFALCDLTLNNWSAYTACGQIGVPADQSDWFPCGIALGDSNTFHIFYFQLDASGFATSSLQQQALHSDNSLGALQFILTGGVGEIVSQFPVSVPPLSILSGGHQQITIAYIGTNPVNDYTHIKVLSGQSADTIAFSSRTVDISSTVVSSTPVAVSLANNATGIYLFFCGIGGGIPTYYYALQPGGAGAYNAPVLIGTNPGGAINGITGLAAIGMTTGGLWSMCFSGSLLFFEPPAPPPPSGAISAGTGHGAFPSAMKTLAALKASLPVSAPLSAFPSVSSALVAAVLKASSPLGLPPSISPDAFPLLLRKNASDRCLAQDFIELDLRDPYAFSCPKPAQCYPSSPPWISMPKTGVKFKPVGILPVAGNFTGLDILVVSLIVDKGYDGVITDITAMVSSTGATGFAEGSGDVIWRLRQNLRWSRDLGNIQVSLGSLLSPGYSGLNRLRIFSGQIVSILVNLLPAAAARINPNANIICSLNGYMYPRT